MKLPISEARRRLPGLVRRICRDAGARVQITVHNQVVAELRAVAPEPAPGRAARRLLDVMAGLPRHQGRKTSVSSRVKRHLYGPARRGR